MRMQAFVFSIALVLSACGVPPPAQTAGFVSKSLQISAKKVRANFGTALPDVPTDTCDLGTPSLDALFRESTEFSAEKSYAALWFSRVVELPEQELLARVRELPLQRIYLVRRGKAGVQAGIFRIEGRVVVAFVGTHDARDMFDNALIAPGPGSSAGLPGLVHSGFRDNFKNIWEEVLGAAKRMGAEQDGVWVMGHSLGGVLSQFAAYNFVKQGIPVHNVLISAPPLPGNSVYQKAYNSVLGSKTISIGFGNDITPNLPPMPDATDAFSLAVEGPLQKIARALVPIMDYQQVGSWYYLTRGGYLEFVANLGEHQKAFYTQMRSDNIHLGLPLVLAKSKQYVGDHGTDNYRCGLREFIARQP